MSSLDNGEYIPYLTLSEEAILSEHNPKLFLLSLFPNASIEQIELFKLFAIGIFHNGLLMGLEVTGEEPIGEIEAYQMGVKDGLNQRS